jgi:ribonuclease-3
MADHGALRPVVPGRRLTPEAPGDVLTAATSTEEAARLIGHEFGRRELLVEALTHPSALAKPGKGRRRGLGPPNYERLEFLGDRVLGLIVADLLWRRFADEPEGHLTRRLTQLVRREALARVAGEMGLGRHLRLSPSEAAAGAARNPGILADVVEAVIAAIYLDGGLPAAFAFVERYWATLIAELETAPPRDPKTTLQEWAQGRGLGLPDYRLVESRGPDHARQFTVAVAVKGQEEASGTARSKRAAETAAAAVLLERLQDAQKGTDGSEHATK